MKKKAKQFEKSASKHDLSDPVEKALRRIDVTSTTSPLTKVRVQQWYQKECLKAGEKDFCTGNEEWLYLGEIT